MSWTYWCSEHGGGEGAACPICNEEVRVTALREVYALRQEVSRLRRQLALQMPSAILRTDVAERATLDRAKAFYSDVQRHGVAACVVRKHGTYAAFLAAVRRLCVTEEGS